MDKRDIHNRKRHLECALIRLDSRVKNKRNKELILKFHDENFSKGLSLDRVLFYLNRLMVIDGILDMSFEDVTKADIMRLVGIIEKNDDYAAWTKANYKTTIKRFFTWLAGDDEPPECVKWLRCNLSSRKRKLPDDLLSESDIKRMVDVCSNPRDKAMIITLYEGGFRVGEFLNIRLKDLVFCDHGVKIQVHGKTGSRRVLLIDSLPYLSTWINSHPNQKDRDSYLWVSIQSHRSKDNICYRTFNKLLVDIAKAAGVDKKVNPHNYRHSRASHLAMILTEAAMCKYFGWAIGSDMPAVYVHLSGKDIDEAILRMHGIVKEEEKDGVFGFRACPRCKVKNSLSDDFCVQCRLALNPKAASEVEENEKQFLRMITPQMIEEMINRKFEELKQKNQENITQLQVDH